jgi:hypothetical protein
VTLREPKVCSVADSRRSRRVRWVLVLFGIVLLLATGGFTLNNWLDLSGPGPGHFPGSLLWAIPKASPSAVFDDLSGRDATFLNRTNNGAYRGQHLSYVSADTVSTGPTVISVNSISRYLWAATAQSDRACYGVLISEDSGHPAYGSEYYARFPSGTACAARIANPATVRAVHVPK